MRRSLLSARGLGSLLPTSARDWAHPFPHLHATGLTPAASTLVESLGLNTMHAHVCAGALRRAHVPSDGAASMPYAARNLQPGSAARSVGSGVGSRHTWKTLCCV